MLLGCPVPSICFLSLEREKIACSTTATVGVLWSLLQGFFNRDSEYQVFAAKICLHTEKLNEICDD